MGGKYTPDNIAYLTPEEHFLAHQLLIKIFPDNDNLVNAVVMMTHGLPRISNKCFGWIRRKAAKVQSKRMAGKTKSDIHRLRLCLANRKSHHKHFTKEQHSFLDNFIDHYVTFHVVGKMPLTHLSVNNGFSSSLLGKWAKCFSLPVFRWHSMKQQRSNQCVELAMEAVDYARELWAHIQSLNVQSQLPISHHFTSENNPMKDLRVARRMAATKHAQGIAGTHSTQQPSTKKIMSEAQLRLPKVSCPHCGKSGKKSIMSRWHFDKCGI
ncbi:MAG: hypothetical protein ACREQ5_08650 [Candidatus Dormibacteria bacterium]